MGFGGISSWQLLIILAIVLLLFGGKRIRGLGSDLGNALKGFRKSVKDADDPDKPAETMESERVADDPDKPAETMESERVADEQEDKKDHPPGA